MKIINEDFFEIVFDKENDPDLYYDFDEFAAEFIKNRSDFKDPEIREITGDGDNFRQKLNKMNQENVYCVSELNKYYYVGAIGLASEGYDDETEEFRIGLGDMLVEFIKADGDFTKITNLKINYEEN